MKRKVSSINLTLLLGFALLALVLLIFLCQPQLPKNLRYVEGITGLHFPKGISEILTTQPREFCLSGRMKLPQDQVAKFLETGGFKLSRSYPLNHDLGTDGSLFSKPSSLGDWMRLAGRTVTHRWEFAYNPTNRLLYFVMLFPDAGGDPPP